MTESHYQGGRKFYGVFAICLLLLVAASVYIPRPKLPALSQPQSRRKACSHDVSIHKTQMLRCKVSHYRMFPKKRGFEYSYLSAGIPVRSAKSNWLLSVDTIEWCQRGLLHVTAKDHLNRTEGRDSLSTKLDTYLRHMDLDPNTYPNVYLFTTARFMSYMFSPASFWYLYTNDLKLAYVIAEVNNTFDERRMYLFQAPDSDGVFKQTCNKDFHVSPFNSRKGTYELKTTDPRNEGSLSVTVTLLSSKGYPKLITRWWSVAPATEPSRRTVVYSLWIIATWGWTVLVTFLRIGFQATLLAQIDRLSIWYRPEPRTSAIPRRATSSEKLLASILDQYLAVIIHGGSLSYSRKMEQQSMTFDISIRNVPKRQGTTSPYLAFRIHTPQFYRQMITYPSLNEYLSYTLLGSSEENHTAQSADASSLIDLVSKLETLHTTQYREWKNSDDVCIWGFLWAMYGRLRSSRRLVGAYPELGAPKARTSAPTSHPVQPLHNISTNDICFLDGFVRRNCPKSIQVQYMLALLGLQWRTKVLGIIGGE
ncbi:DUF1365-domain-containing protein [Xylaria intraflava]|nr:DUF1365-domain-containing protein [Xylaria intraflava]